MTTVATVMAADRLLLPRMLSQYLIGETEAVEHGSRRRR
jgi:hypothetical protein